MDFETICWTVTAILLPVGTALNLWLAWYGDAAEASKVKTARKELARLRAANERSRMRPTQGGTSRLQTAE